MNARNVVALFLAAAALAATGTLNYAQNRVEAPTAVSALAPSEQALTLDKEFVFQIRFDRPPRNYRGGTVRAIFTWQSVGSPAPDQPHNSEEEFAVNAQAPMQDGQAIYTMRLDMHDSMALGRWVLTEVVFGRSTPTTLTVTDHVAFELVGPGPISITIDGPSHITAGDEYKVTLGVRALPVNQSKLCKLFLNARLAPLDNKHGTIDVGSFQPEPGALSKEFSVPFNPDFGNAQFQLEVVAGSRIPDSSYQFCKVPPLEGPITLPLTVVPAKDLVSPTSVNVTVNPNQKQLLSGEADRLMAKAARLQAEAQSQKAGSPAKLRDSLNEAILDVDKTEKAFRSASDGPSANEASAEFFDDIRANYLEAQKAFASLSPAPKHDATLLDTKWRLGSGIDTRTTAAVVAAIRHNAKAYAVVAEAGSLAFDIEVKSSPVGATISYGRFGDKSFEQLDEKTNAIIRKRIYAVWYVRFDLPKYKSRTLKCDPFIDSRHLVDAHLEPE
jgi:hypothetical protein